MKYKAYPKYKPSGVEWLGEVPEHWRSVLLKWVSRRYAGGTPDKSIQDYWEDGTIPWLNSGAVNDFYIEVPSAYITEEAYRNSSAKWIAKCNLVIALAGQGKTKGMVAQLGIDTTCNQSMAAICPRSNINARFLLWWLTHNYINIRNLAGGDQRDGLNLVMIGGIPVPLIPHEEQKSIADFLDRETGKIDELIAKKEKLIELLKEKRTALISRAVTKGINPNVRLKPSGVEWLGDVPEGWEIKKLGYITRCLDGKRIPLNAEERGEMQGDIPYWGANGIVDYVNKWLFDEELVLLGEDGAPFFEKHKTVAFLVSGKVWVNNHVHVLKADDSCFQKYLVYSLNNTDYGGFIDGSTRDKLTQSDMNCIPIAFPSYHEQQSIADFLDRETGKIDELIAKVSEVIEKLKEYRTALISAAVTGKIDVREEVTV